jgi:hypothetical protein
MLLVLKYVDNEIIKNRDYNTKYNLKRKIVVVIDEAHVFIDNKFPVALDFMFQLAKRIRKYNGMQIVITQNIKDFVGSEELARKSTAIINACQYSFIFSLAPNDIHDLCKLYEKAGGINEIEQEQITTAPRGQAFTIMSPTSRSTFKVEVPKDVTAMFRQPNFVSRYFIGEKGAGYWEDFVAKSRPKRAAKMEELQRQERDYEEKKVAATKSKVIFEELEFEPEAAEMPVKKEIVFLEEIEEKPEPEKKSDSAVLFEEFDEDDFSGIVFEEISESEESAAAAAAPVQEERAAAKPVEQQPSRTEEMLFELMGKFSYESMVSEIRRTVRAEMERETQLAAVSAAPITPITPVAPVAPAAPVEPEMPVVPVAPAAPVEPEVPVAPIAPVEPVEQEIPVDITPAEDEVFNPFPMLEDIDLEEADEMALQVAEEIREEEQRAEEELVEQEEPVFDIMQLLAAEAEKLANVSPIDMMDTYGELVIEVTLEELVHYNNAQRNKRRMR